MAEKVSEIKTTTNQPCASSLKLPNKQKKREAVRFSLFYQGAKTI
jgi:hypothetical protein